MVKVVAIVDNSNHYVSTIDGIPLVKPDILLDNASFDYLIITVINRDSFYGIVDQALKVGVERKKILPLRIFEIPFFSFDDYIRIKESNISLFSDYCFAGFLYYRFGFKHTSPTINMFADNDNYYKFISEFDKNMMLPMEEVNSYYEKPFCGMYAYPRGRIGNSEWQFNHDISFETAKQRWDKGVSRFNKSNYIVFMTIRSDEMAYKFEEVKLSHKVGFYWKDLHLKSVVCLPDWENPEIRLKYGHNFSTYVNEIAAEREGERAINWMKLLKHEKDYMRIR